VRRPSLLKSVTFRLALVYAGVFGASALLLLGFVYWSTAAYLSREADAAIEAEVAVLAERYRAAGLSGLTASMLERITRRPAGSSVYLLADERLHPLVGNLSEWPAGTASPKGWVSFRLEEAGWPPGQVHLARARVFRLTGGYHLLVGRDLHELTHIQGLIVRTLLWGLAITAALTLAGGALMSRSTARRVEAVNETARVAASSCYASTPAPAGSTPRRSSRRSRTPTDCLRPLTPSCALPGPSRSVAAKASPR